MLSLSIYAWFLIVPAGIFLLAWVLQHIIPESVKPEIFKIPCKECGATCDNYIPRLCTDCWGSKDQHPSYDEYHENEDQF